VITGSVASAVDAPVAETGVSECVGSAALGELIEVEGVGALVAAGTALVSVFEELVELVWAPPVLTAVPDRGSAVDVVSSVEPDVDEPVVTDDVVEPDEDDGDVDPLADELDAESADELDDEGDDDESDDDVEEMESGSANAMPGMVATAIPIPSETTKAPRRPA
jgi:hypothetical protein